MVGQSCPGYFSGDVDDFKTNLMMLFGAWHTRINDAKDHSIFKFFTNKQSFSAQFSSDLHKTLVYQESYSLVSRALLRLVKDF